jgi:hypothetical protein
MEYICPVLGEGDERDFIAIGQAENFKIAVFTNLCIMKVVNIWE